MSRRSVNRWYAGAFLVLALVGTQAVPVAAQFTAQIQLALQQLGIWPYNGSYVNGDFPVWNTTSGKFVSSSGGGGSSTVIFALTSNAVGIGATSRVLTLYAPTLGASSGVELLGNRNGAQQALGSVNFLNESAAASNKYVSRIIGLTGLSGDVDSGALSFTTYNDSGVSATRMLIDENGNTNLVGTLGWGATLSAPDVVLFRPAADTVALAAGDAFGLATKAWINTAPSGPVACTSPAVTWSNGTAAFQIDVGTSCTLVTTLVVTLPAVTNAYSCTAVNTTTSATAAVEMTASTTTTATFTNYTRTTGIALAWVDGTDVRIACTGGWV